MQSNPIIKNALISISDKSKIIDIAQSLIQNKINLFATAGTAKILKKNNIPVILISDYTKFPEIMDGRIKTLHPKIIAGILGRRKKDKEIMNLYNIMPMDIVIINFYPFEKIYKDKEKKNDDIIDYIDIGGPTLVRSAAKNYKDVIIIVDLADYKCIIQDIKNNTMNIKKRLHLASKAFQYTLSYEQIISEYFIKKDELYNKKTENMFPKNITLQFIKKYNLRYGENQHQKASFYVDKNTLNIKGTISTAKQIHGKKLSYNNISDADIALECVKEFIDPACVIVKHGNPCGVSVSKLPIHSYISAYQSDPLSAFGGVIAFNCTLDLITATTIISNQFVEVIIAPEINSDALCILKNKKNIRILYSGSLNKKKIGLDFKRVNNGLLIQEYDVYPTDYKKWNCVTKRMPTKNELKDAIFCWKITKFVKSNAIVYGRNNVTIGIGAGQMSRIYSTKIANIKAQENNINLLGATMSSDAFFPFIDGVENAASVGISCIVQPGGSIRDKEIIQVANKYNIAMIFTHIRHFKH